MTRKTSPIAGVKLCDRVRPQAAAPLAQELEETMPLKVVLAVSVDSWMLATHRAEWRSAGFIVLPVTTIREAVEHFRTGDFDLVLLGIALSVETKERLSFLIRSSGSRTPIVSIADSSENCDQFANATITNDACTLLQAMGELLAAESNPHLAQIPMLGAA
jgi:DNA-binding LytR/AlgR family response regulator